MDKSDRANLVEIVAKLKEDRVILNDVEIVEKTGFSAPYISNILSKRQKPSQNFVDRFNDVFFLETKKFSTQSKSTTDTIIPNQPPKNRDMTTETQFLRQRIADLEALNEAQRKVIDLYEKEKPSRKGEGSKRKAV